MYRPTPADLEHVSVTAEATAAKYLHLARGELTPLLMHLADELRAICDGADVAPSDPTRFTVQLFDDASLRLLPKERWDEFAERFTAVNLPYWCWDGEYGHVSPAMEALIESTGVDLWCDLRVVATPWLRETLLEAGSPEAAAEVRVGWDWQPKRWRANILSGDVVELWIKALLIEMAHLVAKHRVAGFVLDSEFRQALVEGEVSVEVARAEGTLSQISLWPTTLAPVGQPYCKVLPADDLGHRWRVWLYGKKHHGTAHGMVRQIAREVWPDCVCSEDCQYSWFELPATDRMQSWVSVHPAPGIPLNVAWLAAWHRAKNRFLDTQVPCVVGPQLGYNHWDREVPEEQREAEEYYWRATPADLYSAGCWLSISQATQGVIGWGIELIFDEAGHYRPNGEALWERMRRLGKEVFRPLNDLLMRWQVAPARTAILDTIHDWVEDSGVNGQHGASVRTPIARTWVADHAVQNVFFATLLAGEPADLVCDLRPDLWADYEVLIIPRLYVAPYELCVDLAEYQRRGGLIIVHDGSALELPKAREAGIDVEALAILDEDYGGDAYYEPCLTPYFALYGPGRFDQYDLFLDHLADDLSEFLPGGPRLRFPGEWIVASELIDGTNRYLVLVNHTFVAGEEDKWIEQTTGKRGKSCEQGVWVTTTNVLDRPLRDCLSGDVFRPGAIITLLPGWGRVLKIEEHQMATQVRIPREGIEWVTIDDRELKVQLRPEAEVVTRPEADDSLGVAYDGATRTVALSVGEHTEPSQPAAA